MSVTSVPRPKAKDSQVLPLLDDIDALNAAAGSLAATLEAMLDRPRSVSDLSARAQLARDSLDPYRDQASPETAFFLNWAGELLTRIETGEMSA